MKTFQHLIALVVIATLLVSQLAKGDTWYTINSGTTANLNCIYFPSAQIGYIGGEDTLLLKTYDGGASWQKINLAGINFIQSNRSITNLQFLNDTIGFMVIGPYGGSWGTDDGGQSWTALSLPSNQCFNNGLYFFDENNGFVGGSACFSGELISGIFNSNWKTSTFQATNVTGTLSPNYLINDIEFLNDTFGLAVSGSGYVFRTTDGGNNWDSIRGSMEMNPLTSVLIVNDTLAYAGYNANQIGFGLYVSTDAGLTWAQDMNSATFYYPDFLTLHLTAADKIYTGGISQNGDGLIFNATVASPFWSFDVVNQQIRSIHSYVDSIVFAVGDSGYITSNHQFQPNQIKTVSSPPNQLQLFPNPSTGIINLANLTNNLAENQIRISAYNGAFIKEITGHTSFDLSTLKKGIYLIKLKTENGTFHTKLVLN